MKKELLSENQIFIIAEHFKMENSSIYFGEVVDVNDDELKYRVRVIITGYTHQIEKDNLPWYFPFFGISYLPVVGDILPIIIFNGNFSTGFYNNKINLPASTLSGTEYQNYLEVYKRLGVQISYTESLGIELINGKSKIQIEKDKTSIFVDGNQFVMVKDRIDLGTNGEATPLGDKTVKALQKQIDMSNDMFKQCMGLFEKIKSASVHPILKPIKAVLSIGVPISKNKINPEVTDNTQYITTIQSKKTFIE